MWLQKLDRRYISLIAALLAFSSIGIALIMEHVFKLIPCPLCIVQRVIVIAIGIFFLFEFISFNKKKLAIASSFFAIIFSALGMFVAARHVWLQYLPKDEIPGCLPGLGYMMDTFSLVDVAMRVYAGSSDCAAVKWRFLGLSIPEQTFVMFTAFMLFASLKTWLHFKSKKTANV